MEYLYCGGRFDFDYNDAAFEKKVAKDYRAILLNDVNKLLNKSDVVVLSSRLAYIGPYYFETDGMLDQDIVEMEKRQIERCTVAVFLLDNSACPDPLQKWFMPRRFTKEFSSTMSKMRRRQRALCIRLFGIR